MVVEDEELMLSGSGEEECDCWDIPPPPEFHLPPPPEPPDFCSHPISPPSSFHTCDSIMPQEVDLEKSQPTVPVAVIVICAAVLGLTLTIASVFLFCRYRRKLRPSLPGKGSSEKINSLATSAVGLFYEDLNNSTPRPLPPSNQYCLSQIDHFTNPSVTGESRGASSSELSSFIRLAHVPSSSFDNQSGRISCSPVYEEVKTCSMLRIRGSPVGSRPRRNHWQQQQHQDHNQIDHPVPNIYQDTDSLRSSVLYCDPLLASDGSLNQQRPRRTYHGGSRLSGGSYEEPDFHEGLLRQMTSRRPPTSYSADMSEEDEDMALSRLGGPSKRNGMDLYVKPVESESESLYSTGRVPYYASDVLPQDYEVPQRTSMTLDKKKQRTAPSKGRRRRTAGRMEMESRQPQLHPYPSLPAPKRSTSSVSGRRLLIEWSDKSNNFNPVVLPNQSQNCRHESRSSFQNPNS